MYALIIIMSLTVANPQYTGVVWIKSAGACPACDTMQPAVETLILEGKPILVVSVADVNELAHYDNRGRVPITILYDSGKELDRYMGVINEKQLRAMLVRIRKQK